MTVTPEQIATALGCDSTEIVVRSDGKTITVETAFTPTIEQQAIIDRVADPGGYAANILTKSGVKVTDRYVFAKNPLLYPIVAVHGDHLVVRLTSASVGYHASGVDKFSTKDMVTVNLNSATFPDLTADSAFHRIVFFNTAAGVRSLVFTNKNQIYYSDGQVFGNFKQSKVWTLAGEEYKHPSISEKDPTDARYAFHTPANIATRNYQYLWMGGSVWPTMGWASNGFLFANYAGNTTPSTAVADCMFFTLDGANIYTQYMFGIFGRRVKKAGTVTYVTSTLWRYGDLLDTSGFTGAYSSGLTCKSRTNIVPSAADLDPTAIFELGTERTVVSFTRATPALCELNDTTDIEPGETIYFGGDASDAEWNALRNLTASTTSGGSGRFYMVTAKNGNVLTLADVIGNPNNNLICRHIHTLNSAMNGVVLGTGEEYPQSWFIYFRTYNNSINYAPTAIRLNGSENSLQRTLGTFIRPDGKLIHASDTDGRSLVYPTLTVRGQGISINSAGLWVGAVADIDDRTKYELKIPNISAAYQFRLIGSTLFLSTHKGETFISRDNGDSWEHVVTDGNTKSSYVGADKSGNRYFFANDISFATITDPTSVVYIEIL